MEWTTFSKTSQCTIFLHERVALGEFPGLVGIGKRRLNHSAQMTKAATEGQGKDSFHPLHPLPSTKDTRKNLRKREKVCWGKELARSTWLRSRDRWQVLDPILGNLWGDLSSLPMSQDLQQNSLLHNCLYGDAWGKQENGTELQGLGGCKVEKKNAVGRKMSQRTRFLWEEELDQVRTRRNQASEDSQQ